MRVLYVGRILPHYRLDVYRELEKSFSQMHYAAGENDDRGIATIAPSELQNVHILKNWAIGRIHLQSGFVRALRRARPDVVIFEGDVSYLSTWWYATLCRTLGMPVFFWTIGWHRPERGMVRILRGMFYRIAHHLLIYGERGKQLGVDAGHASSRMTVIRNSISRAPSGESGRPRREYIAGLPTHGRPAVGAVIRLTPQKRLDLILRAVALLKDSSGPIDVVLVGEGPERQRLSDLARELGVDLYLPGSAYAHEDLARFYSITSVSVIPRLAGLTTIQSLTYGVPVITNNDWDDQAPEAEAIKHGSNGLLYTAGDVSSLANAIREIVTMSPSDRNAMETSCKDSVREFWSPAAHASAITRAVYEVSAAVTGPRRSRWQ